MFIPTSPISNRIRCYFTCLINDYGTMENINADFESYRILEADKSRVIRFKENCSDPTDNSGIALGDNYLYEITGRWNLESFRVIGI